MVKADKVNELATSLKPILASDTETLDARKVVDVIYADEIKLFREQILSDAAKNDLKVSELNWNDKSKNNGILLELQLATAMIEENWSSGLLGQKAVFLTACMNNFNGEWQTADVRLRILNRQLDYANNEITSLKTELAEAENTLSKFEQNLTSMNRVKYYFADFQREVRWLYSTAALAETQRLEKIQVKLRLQSLDVENGSLGSCFVELKLGRLDDICAFELALFLIDDTIPNAIAHTADQDRTSTKDWAMAVRKAIDRKKFYPNGTTARGRVVLDLEISKSGTLLNASIAKSSGDKILDKAALLSAGRARYPAGPEILPRESYKFRIPMLLSP